MTKIPFCISVDEKLVREVDIAIIKSQGIEDARGFRNRSDFGETAIRHLIERVKKVKKEGELKYQQPSGM